MFAEDVVPAEDEVGSSKWYKTLSSYSYHSVSAFGSSTGTLIGVSISGCSVTSKRIHNHYSETACESLKCLFGSIGPP